MAAKVSKNTDPLMNYKDFRLDAPRHLTRVNHETYIRTTPASAMSPWKVLPGWALETCLHDMLHVVYLGTAKDLIASLLADWLDFGLLGPQGQSLDYRLRVFSIEMNKFFKNEKLLGNRFSLFCLVWFFYSSISGKTFKYDKLSKIKMWWSLRFAVRKLHFTAKNTGLSNSSDYPELGRAWKAAHIKVVLGYMALKACEFAAATGETCCNCMYVCKYHL